MARRTEQTEEAAAPRRVTATSWPARRGAQRPPRRRVWRARRETGWASRRAQKRPAVSTARRARSAHRVRGGTMPTVQVPSSAGSNRAPLLVGVPRVATSTVTTIDRPRPLESMRPPSLVAIAKAGGGKRSPLPRMRHVRWRGGRGGGTHVETVTGALAGTGRGERKDGGVTVALGASPPRLVGTLPARHGRRAGRSLQSRNTDCAVQRRCESGGDPREGRPGVRAGCHTSAGTSGKPPGPPEDATHALRQAPTRAREHCDRSPKSLCVAADHNPRAGRVGLRPTAMRPLGLTAPGRNRSGGGHARTNSAPGPAKQYLGGWATDWMPPGPARPVTSGARRPPRARVAWPTPHILTPPTAGHRVWAAGHRPRCAAGV